MTLDIGQRRGSATEQRVSKLRKCLHRSAAGGYLEILHVSEGTHNPALKNAHALLVVNE